MDQMSTEKLSESPSTNNDSQRTTWTANVINDSTVLNGDAGTSSNTSNAIVPPIRLRLSLNCRDNVNNDEEQSSEIVKDWKSVEILQPSCVKVEEEKSTDINVIDQSTNNLSELVNKPKRSKKGCAKRFTKRKRNRIPNLEKPKKFCVSCNRSFYHFISFHKHLKKHALTSNVSVSLTHLNFSEFFETIEEPEVDKVDQADRSPMELPQLETDVRSSNSYPSVDSSNATCDVSHKTTSDVTSFSQSLEKLQTDALEELHNQIDRLSDVIDNGVCVKDIIPSSIELIPLGVHQAESVNQQPVNRGCPNVAIIDTNTDSTLITANQFDTHHRASVLATMLTSTSVSTSTSSSSSTTCSNVEVSRPFARPMDSNRPASVMYLETVTNTQSHPLPAIQSVVSLAPGYAQHQVQQQLQHQLQHQRQLQQQQPQQQQNPSWMSSIRPIAHEEDSREGTLLRESQIKLPGGIIEYACPICRQRFDTKSSLWRHCKRLNHGFICDMCGSGFVRAEPFKQHRLLHTNRMISISNLPSTSSSLSTSTSTSLLPSASSSILQAHQGQYGKFRMAAPQTAPHQPGPVRNIQSVVRNIRVPMRKENTPKGDDDVVVLGVGKRTSSVTNRNPSDGRTNPAMAIQNSTQGSSTVIASNSQVTNPVAQTTSTSKNQLVPVLSNPNQPNQISRILKSTEITLTPIASCGPAASSSVINGPNTSVIPTISSSTISMIQNANRVAATPHQLQVQQQRHHHQQQRQQQHIHDVPFNRMQQGMMATQQLQHLQRQQQQQEQQLRVQLLLRTPASQQSQGRPDFGHSQAVRTGIRPGLSITSSQTLQQQQQQFGMSSSRMTSPRMAPPRMGPTRMPPTRMHPPRMQPPRMPPPRLPTPRMPPPRTAPPTPYLQQTTRGMPTWHHPVPSSSVTTSPSTSLGVDSGILQQLHSRAVHSGHMMDAGRTSGAHQTTQGAIMTQMVQNNFQKKDMTMTPLHQCSEQPQIPQSSSLPPPPPPPPPSAYVMTVRSSRDDCRVFPNCVHCQVTFSTTALLEDHFRLVHFTVPQNCSHCLAAFMTDKILKRHENHCLKQVPCLMCSKMMYADELVPHINEVHLPVVENSQPENNQLVNATSVQKTKELVNTVTLTPVYSVPDVVDCSPSTSKRSSLPPTITLIPIHEPVKSRSEPEEEVECIGEKREEQGSIQSEKFVTTITNDPLKSPDVISEESSKTPDVISEESSKPPDLSSEEPVIAVEDITTDNQSGTTSTSIDDKLTHEGQTDIVTESESIGKDSDQCVALEAPTLEDCQVSFDEERSDNDDEHPTLTPPSPTVVTITTPPPPQLSPAPHMVLNSKTFMCPICDKLFDLENQFVKHMNVHRLPETTYECISCNRSFSSKQQLGFHLRTHMRSCNNSSKIVRSPMKTPSPKAKRRKIDSPEAIPTRNNGLVVALLDVDKALASAGELRRLGFVSLVSIDDFAAYLSRTKIQSGSKPLSNIIELMPSSTNTCNSDEPV